MRRNAIALAAVIATGAPVTAGAQDNPLAARDLAAACAMCHGTDGAAAPVAGSIPPLAGESSDKIAQRLKEFRDGKRPATVMHQIAKGYNDHQIDAMAAYFAAQKK